MSFGEIQKAIRLREVIKSVAKTVVNELHPPERIGKVFSINNTQQTAQILFPGETVDSLVTVHYARNMIPVQRMDQTFNSNGYNAPADIVRIAGTPGSYYITDFVSGVPASDGPAAKPRIAVYSRWTWYEMFSLTNVPNDDVQRLCYSVYNLAWPSGAQIAQVSFKNSIQAAANAAGNVYFNVSVPSGAWYTASSHRIHNQSNAALDIGVGFTQTFNKDEITKTANGAISFEIIVSNDPGSGAWLHMGPAHWAVSFMGIV